MRNAIAAQAPWSRPDVPVSNRDRVYTADQTSNTVSVIDPAENKLLGAIRLGDPIPGSLSPLYKGQLLVHGLGYSPDSKTLAVVSVGSNSVTLIETATNKIKGVVYVGRSPHEAFFTPNGRELWVTVRGENYVSVIDPVRMKEVRRIELAGAASDRAVTAPPALDCSARVPRARVAADGEADRSTQAPSAAQLAAAAPSFLDIKAARQAIEPSGAELPPPGV